MYAQKSPLLLILGGSLPWVVAIIISPFFARRVVSFSHKIIYLCILTIPALTISHLVVTRGAGAIVLFSIGVLCTITVLSFIYDEKFKIVEAEKTYVESIQDISEKRYKANLVIQRINGLKDPITPLITTLAALIVTGVVILWTSPTWTKIPIRLTQLYTAIVIYSSLYAYIMIYLFLYRPLANYFEQIRTMLLRTQSGNPFLHLQPPQIYPSISLF